MVRPLADLYARARQHGPELVKFGIVGGLGTIIDLGGAAVLHSAYHEGPLESKALSITAATIFTYFGSRFWTFRHRENQPVHREAVLFIALNVVGLIIAEVVIAATTYGLGLKDPLAYNAASFVGTGLGTIFRWYAYRKWVFLAPAEQPLPGRTAAATHAPYYAPWELDPAYLQPGYGAQPPGYSRQPRLEDPFIPNGRVASPILTAPVPAGYAARSPSYAESGPRTPGRHRKR
jgi:putative flippase GtrA